MSLTLRRAFPLPTSLILATIVFTPRIVSAQAPDKPATADQSSPAPAEPARPSHRVDQTATSDPIALIAVRQEDEAPSAPGHSAGSGAVRTISAKDVNPLPAQPQSKPETVAGI